MEAISNYLLTEGPLTEILSWLPVKSLLRFKAVCQSWNCIISSKSFIDKHLHHEGSRAHLHIYWSGKLEPRSETWLISANLLFSDKNLEKYEKLDHLKLDPETQISILRGPCHGIYCVNFATAKTAIWNPSTRRLRPIPCPFFAIDEFDYCEIAFEVDPFTHDFKVVLINAGSSKYFAIYTSSNDSWRYLEDETLLDPEAIFQQYPTGTTLLNGFYYWGRYRLRKQCFSILAFDMHNEVFEEIEVPESIRARDKGQLHLYDDSLALFSVVTSLLDIGMDIWLMKEKGCWTKLLCVILPFPIKMSYGFWKKNKIILSLYGNRAKKLVMYDLDTRTTSNFRVEEGHTRFMWPFSYKESLIAVKGSHDVQDYDIRSIVALEYIHPKTSNEFMV